MVFDRHAEFGYLLQEHPKMFPLHSVFFRVFNPLLDNFYQRRCYEIMAVLLILGNLGLLISGRFHLRIWTTGGLRRVREQVHTALHYSHN